MAVNDHDCAWQNLKNPNKYGLAMWKSPNISTKDRFEAICGMPIEEMKCVKAEICSRFNSSTYTNYSECKDIPSDLVTEEDLVPMNNHWSKVERAVNAQEVIQEICQTIVGSLDTLSRSDIMRTIINVCIFNQKYEKEKKSLQNINLEELNEVLVYKASVEDIQALNLSPELYEQCRMDYFS